MPAPAAGYSEQELMERMMSAATPGPQQAWLLEDCGRWKGSTRSWPAPEAEPFESTAEFSVEGILGGRFTECRYRSVMEGMPPFEGLAITGYDVAAGEFQAMWIDTYGTTMMTGTGRRSADGRTVDLAFKFHCPVRGRQVPLWQQITRESADRQIHRMWTEDINSGRKYLMMEAVYERQVD